MKIIFRYTIQGGFILFTVKLLKNMLVYIKNFDESELKSMSIVFGKEQTSTREVQLLLSIIINW